MDDRTYCQVRSLVTVHMLGFVPSDPERMRSLCEEVWAEMQERGIEPPEWTRGRP